MKSSFLNNIAQISVIFCSQYQFVLVCFSQLSMNSAFYLRVLFLHSESCFHSLMHIIICLFWGNRIVLSKYFNLCFDFMSTECKFISHIDATTSDSLLFQNIGIYLGCNHLIAGISVLVGLDIAFKGSIARITIFWKYSSQGKSKLLLRA